MRDAEPLHQFFAFLPPLGQAHAEHFHHGQQILLDRELAKHTLILRQIAHAAIASAAIHGPIRDVDVVERHLAGVGIDHSASHAEAGGFAGAVGAQETDDLAGVDLEIDAIDDSPPAVDFDQSFDLQNRHPTRPP